MNTTVSQPSTLLFSLVSAKATTSRMGLALVFSWLIALAAQVTIPLVGTPVPVTGQSFAVLLTGILLGRRWGTLAVLLYLAQGGLGLPFFRGGAGGGSHLFMAATSGYLLSFPLAAGLTGWLAERGWDRNFLWGMAAMALGSFVILGCGWLWLSAALGSFTAAFQGGVAPFLVPDAIKIAFAGMVLPLAWRLVPRQ